MPPNFLLQCHGTGTATGDPIGKSRFQKSQSASLKTTYLPLGS